MAKTGFGDLISSTWSKISYGYKDFLKVGGIYYFIPFLVLTLIGIFLLGDPSGWSLSSVNLLHVFFYSLALIVMSIGYVLFEIYLILHSYKGKKNALRVSFKRLFPAVLFYIVVMFFLLLLAIALIIPALIFMIFWALALVVFIVEEKGMFASLGRSYDLIKNNWWRTAGYLLLIWAITWIVGFIFGLLGSFVTDIFFLPITFGYLLDSLAGFIEASFGIVLSTVFSVEYYKARKKNK